IDPNRHKVHIPLECFDVLYGRFRELAIPLQRREESIRKYKLVRRLPICPSAFSQHRREAPKDIEPTQHLCADVQQAKIEDRLSKETIGSCVELSSHCLEFILEALSVRIKGREHSKFGMMPLETAYDLLACVRVSLPAEIMGVIALDHQNLREAGIKDRLRHGNLFARRNIDGSDVRDRRRQDLSCNRTGIPASKRETQQIRDVECIHFGQNGADRFRI